MNYEVTDVPDRSGKRDQNDTLNYDDQDPSICGPSTGIPLQ